MRTLVIGDIHGSFKALEQCLERSGFDKKEDRLIVLGDLFDGWSGVVECFHLLYDIQYHDKLKYIIGNHDEWVARWVIHGDWKGKENHEALWLQQGGRATKENIDKWYNEDHDLDYSDTVYHFMFNLVGGHEDEHEFRSADYFIDAKNNLFVHGGFDWSKQMNQQVKIEVAGKEVPMVYWDRQLWQTACLMDGIAQNMKKPPKFMTDYNQIFIGHTNTARDFPDLKPVKKCNVWNLDQDCGMTGKLTLMDVETNEYWQSDLSKELYRDEWDAKQREAFMGVLTSYEAL